MIEFGDVDSIEQFCSFDRSLINAPGPCVLFATPGMISGGFSLEVFKHWAPCEANLVTLPGYCVAGTVGHGLMSCKTPTKVNVDEDTQIDVRCKIHQLSFSPHTDAKGIMDLIKFLEPKHVILVHGEKPKMADLKERIQSELQIQCYYPANNETVCIPSTHYAKADATDTLIQSSLSPKFKFLQTSSRENSDLGSTDFRAKSLLQVRDERVVEGIMVMEKNKKAKVLHQDELLVMLGGEKHEVKFAHCCPVDVRSLQKTQTNDLSSGDLPHILKKCSLLHLLFAKLSNQLTELDIQDCRQHLQVESFHVSVCLKDDCPHRTTDSTPDKETIYFCCKWSMADDKLAWKVISIMKNLNASVI
ncbi:unnamed protein product [Ilex paraguariensis]|uniref:Cleavage and polyadenylation specificity factor subunit 3-II n=1 Tax=Ilex paraguariensis TaxID=185542 RepID=A0ABC8R0I8_9AQUA